jgi:poly(3-hydroxybutyrate) depolymerase
MFLVCTGAGLLWAEEGAPVPPPLDPAASAEAVKALTAWMEMPQGVRKPVGEAPFARTPLTREDAAAAKELLWKTRLAELRTARKAEMDAKSITLGGLTMKYEVKSFGDPAAPPPEGRSLFISLHGGGAAPAAVNESQWRNQIQLARAYTPKEGLYVAPRAPTNTWNLWHEEHMDRFFARLIENFVALENVNPSRVYVLGYSAGGDGVYQLAPRMADWWAGAAMMAGHPNETQPAGLRNVPFALHVGGQDTGVNRNKVAREWGGKLAALQKADPEGYVHQFEIHENKGHWMDLEDRKAVPWMEQDTRNPLPEKIVWRQDDVLHERLYWLGIPPGTGKAGTEVTAVRKGQAISLTLPAGMAVLVYANDALLDLDKPVELSVGGKPAEPRLLRRTIGALARTLDERGDPHLMFSAETGATAP